MGFPVFAVFGFVVPVALLAVNLIWGFGGVLATVGIFIWLGLAIVLLPTEEPAT